MSIRTYNFVWILTFFCLSSLSGNNFSSIGVIVGSNNPVKVNAAKEAITRLHPNSKITVVSYKADPGITTWKSKHAIGQPFGVSQTAYGAINRTMDCWNHVNTLLTESHDKKYAMSFENGLVAPLEIGKEGKNWHDICFTGITDGKHFIISRGGGVETTFSPAEDKPGALFDAAVLKYENYIMPLIRQGIDLYRIWTNNLQAREDFLIESGLQALDELDNLEKADALVDACAQLGFPASVGPRYNTTFWMRDFAYMAPIYLNQGYQEKYLEALRNTQAEQFSHHEIRNDGYESFNFFGNMPITYIPKANEKKFLLQRIQGNNEEPSWQILLWRFCKEKCPELLSKFPRTQINQENIVERPNLDQYSLEELRQYYKDLLLFCNQVKSQTSDSDNQPPGPSFALRAFMDGTLRNLTPGTRDSEIHYIRAIFTLIKKQPENKMSLLKEFSESMAKAIFYLYANVVDENDGLPRGIDSRDIFSDILYDSKALTNAVFLYEALQFLAEYADCLKETSFSSILVQALQEQPKQDKQQPEILIKMGTSDLSDVLTTELNRLKAAIQSQFLFKGEIFEPRDFIPGVRASIALDNPVIPTPVADIIKEYNPSFTDGTKIDPQGLAYAVLADLVPQEHFEKVVEYFTAADSKIGVQVFVPISGKSKEEEAWLRKVKGKVVWPHVTWTVVRALIKMGAMNMADEQIKKLMKHCGCSEWVAVDPDTQEVFKGGDPEQGWSATSMKMGINAQRKYYNSQ